MTGSVVGRLVVPCGPLIQVRLIVKDRTGAVVRECYPHGSRTRQATTRFEVHGLPSDTYTLEIELPGCCREVRHGVRVEASCVTNVGMVRVMRAHERRIATPLRDEEVSLASLLTLSASSYRVEKCAA